MGEYCNNTTLHNFNAGANQIKNREENTFHDVT